MEVQQFMPAVLELSKKVKQAINAKQKTGFKTDTKFHNNLVTEVDVMAEKMLVEGLSEIFPEAGFIAEEGTGEKAEAWNWIIDPIDGTTNFSRGIPVFSISIALHHPELGVQLGMIHDLGQDHQYWAVAGKYGAFKDEESIACTTTPKLANSLLATGFPYDNFSVQTMYINLLNNFRCDIDLNVLTIPIDDDNKGFIQTNQDLLTQLFKASYLFTVDSQHPVSWFNPGSHGSTIFQHFCCNRRRVRLSKSNKQKR